MPTREDAQVFSGTVTELDVGGDGANSAQLEFSVTPLKGQGQPETFVVLFEAEPQVFSAMTTLLTAAYMAKMIVTITYFSPEPGATPVATNVKLGEPPDADLRARIGFN